MYPYLRLFLHAARARRAPRMEPLATFHSSLICWPWDIDPWKELNNGRTLTLYDLGRIPLALRSGLVSVLERRGWGLTVAGTAIRYRRRVRMFDRLDLYSRVIGWDHRFVYIEQSLWKRTSDECASQAILRTAAVGRDGIVPPAEIMKEFDPTLVQPELPDWVRAWIAAEDQRPWPPRRD